MSDDLDSLASETLSERARTRFTSIKGVFLPEEYKDFADAIENFEVRDDDVWVCSFPKTGTTWTQEMVWGVTHDNDFDSSKEDIHIRFPFLEFSGTTSFARVARREKVSDVPSWVLNSVEFCNGLSSPRHIKSHLPFNLLPRQIRNGERKPKIIYTTRNAKDTCISYYHFFTLLEGHRSTFDQMCQLFVGDKVIYGPFWNHLLGFWEKRHMTNLLLIRFEDMKKDLHAVIKRTASFLGKEFNNKKIQALADHLSFARMRDNPSLNRSDFIEYLNNTKFYGNSKYEGHFFRDGNCGQWKTAMSSELEEKFDEWIKKNLKDHKDFELYLDN
ncbi:hypothetical protein QAD02_001194 [Eretmocerus hayati]|uniref:Uncharacterized protein n=1 Tax=Eretmocerus hayati TaxID=131215 RepID=A0ACC2NFK3_9HYME|nr:hypothetical protein QAD02_001194 [Eretmocerus hayati]